MYSPRFIATLALCASLVSGQEGTITQTSTMTRTMTLVQCNPTIASCPLSASSLLVEASPSLSAAVETTTAAVMPSEILPPAPEASLTSMLLSSSIMASSSATSLPVIESAKPMNQSSTNRWSVSNLTMAALPSGTGSVPTILTTSWVPSETSEGAIPSATTARVTGPQGSATASRASGSLILAALLVAVAAAF